MCFTGNTYVDTIWNKLIDNGIAKVCSNFGQPLANHVPSYFALSLPPSFSLSCLGRTYQKRLCLWLSCVCVCVLVFENRKCFFLRRLSTQTKLVALLSLSWILDTPFLLFILVFCGSVCLATFANHDWAQWFAEFWLLDSQSTVAVDQEHETMTKQVKLWKPFD